MSEATHTQGLEDPLTQLNQVLGKLSLQVRDLFERKQFQQAELIIQQVLSIVPNHPIALMNLATVNLRLQRYVEAYGLFQQAKSFMGDRIDPFVYCGLTESCHFLNKTDEIRHYGQLALSLRKKQVKSLPVVAIPSTNPAAFNPHQPTENIISYSLFGQLPRYCEGAILNVQLAKEIYPEWTCRFYVNETVPNTVIQRLQQAGAQIVHVQQPEILGFFWRFLVLEDPTVKRFLIRDADSLLGYRERAAVDEWISSNQWFHVMRDFYSHSELILAGMWGGCTGVFQQVKAGMIAFIQAHQTDTQRELDQEYLRQAIWPTIQQSLLSHDSQHYDVDALDFPAPTKLTAHEQLPFHIGANDATQVIQFQINHSSAKEITWILRNEQHQEICRYDVRTDDHHSFEVIFPQYYAQQIKAGLWYVESFPKAK